MPELIPAIDLRGGQVVRLRRGDYSQQTTYEVDPVDIAKKFQDAGCKWLHVVDLDGAKEGRPINLKIIEKIIRSTTLKVACARVAPSASDPSRIDPGTSSSSSSVVRAMIGIIITPSASPPAIALNCFTGSTAIV